MKKGLYLIVLFTIMFLGLQQVNASGRFDIHYREVSGEVSRYPTYSQITGYLSNMGYTAQGYNFVSAGTAYQNMKSASGFVIHMHGDAGRQTMANNTYLVGTNGDGFASKAISDMLYNDLWGMKIAIYYGCSTGDTTSIYGDIAQETVNKGALAAVAWKVTTYINEVNEWNRLFFEKAQSDTIVESYRHADYWLRNNIGNVAGDRMQNNRTERGNIYVKIV